MKNELAQGLKFYIFQLTILATFEAKIAKICNAPAGQILFQPPFLLIEEKMEMTQFTPCSLHLLLEGSSPARGLQQDAHG